MQGRIWVESEIGKGSTFYIDVPLGRQAVATNQKYEAVKLADMHVLVVDDNVTNREIAVELLKRWKMRPIAVTGGQAALAELERARREGDGYQLLLLDLCMPDFDGFAVAEYLHTHPDLSAARIILLTSSGQRGDATRCRESGIAAYLHKPYTQRVLFEAIMDTIGLSKTDKAPLVTRYTIKQNKRNLKILLAEDNSINQILATRLLEKLGHSVEVAGNGLIAVNKWKNTEYDLILMDIDMPEMNGIDATNLIRTEEQHTGKHISIIGLTAHAMQGSREKFLAAGMDGYLSKPIDTEALWNELESIKSNHPNPAFTQISSADQLENSSLSFDLKRALPMMDNDMDLFKVMVGIFQEDFPIQLQALRKAIDSGDVETIRHEAHSIKGMVSVFATPEIVAIAQRIEMQPDHDHARDFAELAKALSWLAAALTNSLKSDHLSINESVN
jgi:CheY-like chemotaxis protein